MNSRGWPLSISKSLNWISLRRVAGDSRFTDRLQSLKDLSKLNPLLKVSPYSPPADVSSRIHSVASRHLGIRVFEASYKFRSNAEKFRFLTACAEEFHHPVLNSYLHELCDVSAVIEYYQTPVESPDALYRLSERIGDDLPANLCIQTEPIRFNPNDTSFLKRTAFPGSSNVVSGLATSRRYKGFRAPAARRIGIGHEDRV
ncbi:54S ribosomal protein L50, mitochondrial [Clonorchis sinensis]|uniref:Large ribosomal subunit protein mL50 n=1 Tax=Clonorchis sinensis TaxID=79923 RepID=A0A8T1MB69_CLOSI|nr:54S ribosomal protein L50, mitochondrial [Clonorchis sinensis]